MRLYCRRGIHRFGRIMGQQFIFDCLMNNHFQRGKNIVLSRLFEGSFLSAGICRYCRRQYRTNPFRYLTSTSFNRIRSPLYFFRWYTNIRREPGTPFLPIFCLLSLTCSMYCIKLTSGLLLVNPCRSLKNSTVLWDLIAFANRRFPRF